MINTIKVGMFAKVIGTDAEGQYEYNGLVTKVSIKTGQVAIDCTNYSKDMSTIVVPADEVTILNEEPATVERQQKAKESTPTAPKEKKEKVAKEKGTKGPSETLQKVIDIVKNNPDLKRKQYIEMICTEMKGKTEAFASTYLHNAKAYL